MLWMESTSHRRNPLARSLWCRALIFSLLLAWTSCSINNCVTSHFGRHATHMALLTCLLQAFQVFSSMPHCYAQGLTHWGRVTHKCVVKLTIIGSDNGLSPGRCQAIIWTNARILLIGPIGTNLIEIVIGIQTFSFKKMHLNMRSAKWRPFCHGLNALTHCQLREMEVHSPDSFYGLIMRLSVKLVLSECCRSPREQYNDKYLSSANRNKAQFTFIIIWIYFISCTRTNVFVSVFQT